MRWYERNIVRCGRHGTQVEISPELAAWMKRERRRQRWRAVRGFPLRVLRFVGRLLLR